MTEHRVGNNPSMTIYQWQLWLHDLAEHFGPNATLATGRDGGNVTLTVKEKMPFAAKFEYNQPLLKQETT